MAVQYANYLHSRGHKVTIEANEISTLFTVNADIRRIATACTKIRTILHACLVQNKNDVIIADIIAMVFFLSFRNKRRVLYFAQDYDESYYKNPLMKLIIRALYFYCLTICKVPVIAVSEELGELLKRRFHSEVTIVLNGIDREVFHPEPESEYAALKENSKIILVFARHDYRKGFDIAVKVLASFLNEIDRKDLFVWVVGESIDLPFPARYFGFVTPDALRRILSCTDVLLYPSRHEGLPLFVLEAMACGCPVLTTSAVKFVKNGIDAIECGIADSECMVKQLHKMLSDNNLRRVLATQALITVERYDIKVSCRNFESALLEVKGSHV